MSLKVVYMGTPDFAVPALKALCQDPRVQVSLVVSQPDKVRGRGKQLQRTPVAETADLFHIPTFQPQSLRNSPEALQILQEQNADLFIVAAYGQILQQNILDLPKFGCVNLHASLLPRWRGAAPIQWAVASGDAVTGTSLMKMERGLDTGDVFAMEATMIREHETAGELHDRLAELSAQLLIDKLDLLTDPNRKAEPQNHRRTTYARMLTPEDRIVDFNQNAENIAWHILGMAPWPGARIQLQNEAITLGKAQVSPLEVPENAKPGEILRANPKEGLHIVAGNHKAVQILTAQRPGKKMLPVEQMLQGFHIPTGSYVEPSAQ